MTDVPSKYEDASVSIKRATYEDMDLESLLSPLGGFKQYINKGERVLLKTNLLNATEPEKAVVTNPSFVEAVAISVLRAGAIPFIGDSPSGNFSKRRLEKAYKRSGLIEISTKLGIDLNYDTGYKKISIPDGVKLKEAPICDFVLDADRIIALPKIKTHSLMMLTLGLKIMYGAVPGLTKAKYHSKFIRRTHFADMLLDLLSVAKPDLFIMDGIIGMQGDGPMSGMPVKLDLMLASDDPVALDIAVCKILNIEPMGIPVLKQAKLRKMWPISIDYPLLKPENVEFKEFILPSTAGHLLTGQKKPKKYPVILDSCVACGECVKICPKKAIQIIGNRSQVDYTKCIKCFCCHEVCTYNAIKLDVVNL